MVIFEEHIYRWECPKCGHHNTAYYKEVPEMINCINCPGEVVDLERMNFVEWYRTATPEDLAVAKENNAEKLEELRKKYAGDVAVMDAIRGAENN